MTSSSSRTPARMSDTCSADVPQLQATACFTPTYSAIARSKRTMYSPFEETHPLPRQSATYSSSRPCRTGSLSGIIGRSRQELR